jgi:hypothetical protein
MRAAPSLQSGGDRGRSLAVPAPARAPSTEALLRPLLWTLLGAWIGAMGLFGGVLARVVFEVVPPETAGRLVGRVLGPLLIGGAGVGLALSALGGALRRGPVAVVLPLLLAGMCLFSHFWVSPAVAAIRVGDPSAGPDAAVRFARLHALSMALFVATSLGIAVLALLHGWREQRESRLRARSFGP